jgi:uncharacterized membrane protein YcaP (DUF421 family)
MKLFIDVVLQTLLSFFAILFIARILGRQQVAQLTVFEYINGITFGSIAATLATDTSPKSWPHFVGLVLFGALTYLMSLIATKSRTASKVIEGEPVLVVQDGKILEKNLTRFHYTVDDLTHLLRKKDVFAISDVKYAILETTGEISILKIPQKEYVKLEDLKLYGKREELETDIIVTGKIIYENLKKRNLNVKWLLDQLKLMGVSSLDDIYYATLDENDKLYIDSIRDNLTRPVDITEKNT